MYPTLATLGLIVIPLMASADTTVLDNIIRNVGRTLQTVIAVLFVIATIVFLWGVILYIAKSSPEERTKSKGIMLFGIIGLAVMAGAWGIVTILVNYFGANTPTRPVPPPFIF